MVELKRQLLAIPLLIVLFLATIPAETFHKHHSASIICHESIVHFETDNFDCELCDFILPVFNTSNLSLQFDLKDSYFAYIEIGESTFLNSHSSLPSYRAPPQVL